MIERFGLASRLAVLGLVVLVSGGAEPVDDWQARVERHRERAHLPPPEGYPRGGREDTFAEQSFAADFATRREAFLDHCVQRPSGGAWGQMILAERGLPVWEGSIYGNLLHLDRRRDCADFAMQGILRLLYQFSDSGALSEELLDHAKQSVLDLTTTVSKLCFGLGQFRGASMSATALALSPKYRMPQVLYEISNDPTAQGMVSRQRMGTRIDEAARWGLGFDDVEDGMVWLSLEAHFHSKTLPLFIYKDRELIVDGRKSVWICELGRRATGGEFAEFVERIAAAPVEVSDLQVTYESPSQGRLEFGWTGPLMQKDVAAALRDYPRYDNPFAQAEFPAERVTFRHGDHRLTLDWQKLERTTDQ
jgi:hypothetical protein